MKMLRIGGRYFTVVFAVGFVLGTIRVLLVAPNLGARLSDLIEAPIMIAVSLLSARWLVRRYPDVTATAFWLGVGLVGLGLLLLVEFTVVLWVRGLSFSEYLATRDPVSSTVYFASLGAFAVFPAPLCRREARSGVA
jgi:hypothetical protein